MKIVGTMDTRNDGDLLGQVLADPALKTLDEIYVYNDGSTDNTREILLASDIVTRIFHRDMFSLVELNSVLQHRRHFLLEEVKRSFPNEEVWIVRLEGDRFFLNQNPREIVELAIENGHDYRCGVMIDFRRSMEEGWHGVDTWPNWHAPIQEIQTYARIDDIHKAIAFKVTPELKYEKKRPWPNGLLKGDFISDVSTNKSMAFLAHHGRRGPKYWNYAYTSGSRPPSKKSPESWDYSSPERAERTIGFPFQTPNLIKWEGLEASYPLLQSLFEKEKAK